ncbi:MAG: hypothetical protein A2293_07365 [Elusimicrobia bacterium RIFOXYB2_FULL_49_7]|nr:MAG: hypothetical protein A2293_07365 [Elusimicrobia bacterium RIFOXYB2_FULL_49_7]
MIAQIENDCVSTDKYYPAPYVYVRMASDAPRYTNIVFLNNDKNVIAEEQDLTRISMAISESSLREEWDLPENDVWDTL